MSKYDFESDYWPDDERLPYKLMQWFFFQSAYQGCKSGLSHQAKWQEKILGCAAEYAWAYEQSESLYQPIESLMREVIALIANAGRHENENDDYTESRYERIHAILENNNLQDLLKDLPKEEREEFERDLKLLNVMT